MNGAFLLIFGLGVFSIAYLHYGKYLTRLFGIQAHKQTPAHTFNDGIDFVPTKAPIVFGHHFASIAGAGPIVGPVLGACFGWLPVALWIIFGCVLIGAAHDFFALFISVRNKGQSIPKIIEKYVGFTGRQIFLVFCMAALILVNAVFALLIAKTFVTSPAVATASVFFIFLAVLFGILVYQKHLAIGIGTLIFIPIVFAGIKLGVTYPLDLTNIFHITEGQAINAWVWLLFIYVFIASVIPVWLLLQPRDYLNSYLLYALVILGVVSIIFVSPEMQLSSFENWIIPEPIQGKGTWAVFPILFVTVACGACSGFHALVASGTTSKQIASEKHILPIGYGAMLVEGVLGLISLISVAVLSQGEFNTLLTTQGAVSVFATGLARLSEKIGLSITMAHTLISLAISAFMLTTLDTATRITRYMVQGLCEPSRLSRKKTNKLATYLNNRYLATLLVVFLSGYLALSGESGKIWPVFGASNQLLAALTLLMISLILIKRKLNYWIALLPFLFMFFISVWALLDLISTNFHSADWPLMAISVLLIIMAGVMAAQAWRRVSLWQKFKRKRACLR